jgi:hypothetical protein
MGRETLIAIFVAAGGAGAAAAATAATEGETKLRGLGLQSSDVGMPGFGRVLAAFVLVAALAWGATWLLRRYGYRLPAAVAGGAHPIRHLARQTLPGGVACHVIETQGRQVLITVTRSGVASLDLGAAPPAVPAAATEKPA